MPNAPKTPRQTIRIAKELWEQYRKVVMNRSEDIREYIEWRVNHPGVPLPKRTRRKPPQPEQSDITAPTPEQPE